MLNTPPNRDSTGACRFAEGRLISEVEPRDRPELWRYDSRLGLAGGWVTDAMHWRHLSRPLGESIPLWEPVAFSRTRLKTLRPDQIEACEAWNRTKNGVVVMATGTGKTEIALHLVSQVASHTLFVAPTRALAYQLAGRIEEAFGCDVGFIGDQTFRLRPICVTTYDSAWIKMPILGNYFQFLIFDECHHLPGRLRSDAARMSAAPYRLGLTATPGHDQSCNELIGPICYENSIATVRGTLLAEYRIRRVPVCLTDEEQSQYDALGRVISDHILDRRKDHPEYDWQAVCLAIGRDPEARHAFYSRLKRRSIEENAAAKLDVLEDLFCAHTQQVVVFTGSNQMARAVSTRFLIPCLLAHTKRKERALILDGYQRGEFRGVVANRVLNEGVDLPGAKVGIVIGGTGEEREAIQRLGRILRKKGVEEATWYEVVCAGTGEEQRSRGRRRNSAYQRRNATKS